MPILKTGIFFVLFALAIGCSTSPRADRKPDSYSNPPTPFEREASLLGQNIYFANLHAHHFMQWTSKQGPPPSEIDLTQPGRCPRDRDWPQYDGRPCRNNAQDVNSIVPVAKDENGQPRVIDYFKMACDYAKEKGGLDILYITPHSKNNNSQDGVANTLEAGYVERQKLLSSINRSYEGTFLCGLGQEASAISSGNHLGILGHFPMLAKKVRPFYFKSGAFNEFYPEVRRRVDAGDKVILQLNHPDTRKNLWFGRIPSSNKKFWFQYLHDYGLDDFAPMKCQKNRETPDCVGVKPTPVTNEVLRATYDNIRAATADRFRLIEIVPTVGATSNPGESMRPVHRRQSPYPFLSPTILTKRDSKQPRSQARSIEDDEDDRPVEHLLYDYIYYLNMGFKLAPVANQDNHHMNWGTAITSRTGVLAPSLSEDAVVKALDQRRTYATEDANARLLFFAEAPETGKATLMGGELETSRNTVKLVVGYQDPDTKDAEVLLRFYYYRANETLDFSRFTDPAQTVRLLSIRETEAALPSGALNLATLRDANFSTRIISGNLQHIELPLVDGDQYVFVEMTQSKDFDKIWSAPIWIRKK